MQRRAWLKLGAASAVVLAVGGGVAASWKPGWVVFADTGTAKLSAEGRLAMGALARALLADALPADAAALNRHLDAFESLVATLQPAVREELALLLSLTTNGAGRLGLFGHTTALHELPVDTLRAALQAMRTSRISLRQQAYFGLRELHCGLRYAEPDTWTLLGYPGPTAI
jgi:hypothetical protein